MTDNLLIQVNDETAPLEAVVLGIAEEKGAVSFNNPSVVEHYKKGTLPTDEDLEREFDAFRVALETQGVQVYRPKNIVGKNQMFARDIAFVIERKIVKATMIPKRAGEYTAIKYLIDLIGEENLLIPPEGAKVEGGDVVLHPGYVFVGQSTRTNRQGYEFLRDNFPDREVVPLEVVSSKDYKRHVLHLDCTLQPIGSGQALFYEGGFVQRPDVIYDIFGEQNLIRLIAEERAALFPNIFSVSPDTVVSEASFDRINKKLRNKGLQVIETPYSEVAKLGGLLRCSTLPLRRQYK